MTEERPFILGISASHNGSACLLHGDEIVVAIQEERLNRRKRQRIWGSRPNLAVPYCLDYAGIRVSDLAAIVVSCNTAAKAEDQDVALNPLLRVVENRVPVTVIPHHFAHAVSAFSTSGFEQSAVLVVDGIGSPVSDLFAAERQVIVPQPDDKPTAAAERQFFGRSETISLYEACGTELRPLEKHITSAAGWYYPLEGQGAGMYGFGSLGGLFSAVAQQIFGEAMEAGKVMGLAPYGSPTTPARDFFTIVENSFVFSEEVPRRFRHSERWPSQKSAYQDLSASVQAALEEALLHLAARLRKLSASQNLCYAGGVALNSVANERIVRESGYRQVHIIPAAEDSGPAIGCAYYGLWQHTRRHRPRRLISDALGRRYTSTDVARAVAAAPAIEVAAVNDPIEQAVSWLCEGKLLGWFEGRAELGPRALGQRSILCDPRRSDGKDVLNQRVKFRESFRPFAPAVLYEEVDRWFELDGAPEESPYMLRVMRFRKERQAQVPAVVHVDGTGRVQTVTEANGRFYRLIQEFHRRTGVPMLLNTSFNIMGEPIVETPEDALWGLIYTGLDACVIEDRFLVKRPGFRSVLDLYPRILPKKWEIWQRIEGGTLELTVDDLTVMVFKTQTPWGPIDQPLLFRPALSLSVLELCNGQRSGWNILAALTGGREKPLVLDEALLVRILGHLKRASILTFSEAPHQRTAAAHDFRTA